MELNKEEKWQHKVTKEVVVAERRNADVVRVNRIKFIPI